MPSTVEEEIMTEIPSCCDDVNDSQPCKECHDHDIFILIPIILIIGLLLVVMIVISCWCYHRRRRRRSREMAILTEKGELIVVQDDRKHAERLGPMVIRLSQLESRRVWDVTILLHKMLLPDCLQLSENNNYFESNPETHDSSQRYMLICVHTRIASYYFTQLIPCIVEI